MSPAVAICKANLENGMSFWSGASGVKERLAFYTARLNALQAIARPNRWQQTAIELTSERIALLEAMA